ncbi:MAG: LPS export ABC transporter permease LptF [Desulfobacterales bacterium]|nr:MAG: LPS export ABC transporter permease LptF [Desulfobacterales bacterium]
MNRIIHRYLLAELLPPFLLNIIFFSFVFLLTEIFKITNMIVNYRLSLMVVGRLMLYSMPYFLVFILPLSVMMAVLLTFLRISGDNEIIALEAAGVSPLRLLPPVLIFCLAGALLTGVTIIFGLPMGKTASKKLVLEVARTSVDAGLKERLFYTGLPGLVIYVNRIDVAKKELQDVFIEDERHPDSPVTVLAPRAVIHADPENPRLQLRLFDGTIHQVDLENRRSNTIQFATYDIALYLNPPAEKKSGSAPARHPPDEKEMLLPEIRAEIATLRENGLDSGTRYFSLLIEFHKKFALPAACLALGLLAMPLGIQSKTARKSAGLVLGLLLFLLYYLLLSAGLVFGEAGVYPPAAGMWMPNLITGAAGACFLKRTAENRPLFIESLIHSVRWLRGSPV